MSENFKYTYVTMEVPEHLAQDVEEYIMDCLAEEMDVEFDAISTSDEEDDSFVEPEDGNCANSDSSYEPPSSDETE